MIKFALTILFLPLLGFVVTLFLGKKIKAIYYFENTILGISLLLSIFLMYFKFSYFLFEFFTVFSYT